ncbi:MULTISPECIES: hypothetical protein [unclassified Ligilactobacillus]|uniref:hypothetical protein n=1 Tax=unclassified Ligilactobacillus TaxID=2767920 RepID=UPI003854E194
MSKKLAFGLGIVSAAAYVVVKNMTPAEKQMVRARITQAATSVKETALKYDRYLHEYLASAEYQHQRQNWEAQLVRAKQTVRMAATTIQERVAAGKQPETTPAIAREDLSESTTSSDSDDQLQDDIILKTMPAKEGQPTETFYPNGEAAD